MTNLIDTNSRSLRLIGAGILGLVLLVAAFGLWKDTPEAKPEVTTNKITKETTKETTSKAPSNTSENPATNIENEGVTSEQVAAANSTVNESTANGRTIMVLGDSISAAYGLEESRGWVSLLQSTLDTAHPGNQVINASVSGETTTGGLQRLPEALSRFSPDVVIIELGGNDGLRGQSLTLMRDNLNTMVDLTMEAGAKPIIVGMRIPPNYGKVYADGFHQTYLDIAREKNVPLVPFLLEPIAEDRVYFQADGIHPTEEAQPLLLDQVMPVVDELMSFPE